MYQHGGRVTSWVHSRMFRSDRNIEFRLDMILNYVEYGLILVLCKTFLSEHFKMLLAWMRPCSMCWCSP